MSLIVVGVVFFAVAPALESDRAATAALRGALFGFFTYATYDLTSQATVRNWTWTLSLTDMAWGTLPDRDRGHSGVPDHPQAERRLS